MQVEGMAMKAGVLAESAFLASAIAFVFIVGSSVASAPVNATSAPENQPRQGEPATVEGYVYEADGVTPVTNCPVNVTNKNTGAWYLTSTDAEYGYYSVWMWRNVVHDGDVFNVTAITELEIGWNESTMVMTYPHLWIDVTMSGAIPEFPSILVPVLGLTCLVVLVSAARRRRN